jgi:hypothetical protein
VTYAEGTGVSVERSKIELDSLLRKHGASQRVFADDDDAGRAVVGFTFGGVDEHRQYRLEIPLPKAIDFATKMVRPSRTRTQVVNCAPEEQRRRHEQACRERWRAIVLLVKAKLELVALGVSSVEREFLADLVLADGATVHRAIADRIREAYLGGDVRPLLGSGGAL